MSSLIGIGARLRQAARRAWQSVAQLKEMTRHHGLWGPGVRLLRNMTLGQKSMVALGCVLAPLAGLLAQSVNQAYGDVVAMNHAVRGLAAHTQLFELERSALESTSAIVLEQRAVTPPGQAAKALQREQAAFQALGDTLSKASHEGPRVTSALEMLKAQRAKAIVPQAASLPPVDRMRAYVADMATLRTELMASWGPQAGSSVGSAALRAGSADFAARLLPAAHRLADEGSALYDAGERRVRLAHLATLVAEVKLLADMAEPQFDQAVAHGAFDNAVSSKSFEDVRRFVNASARLLQAGSAIAADADLATAAGIPASEFTTLGQRGVAAGAALEEAGIRKLMHYLENERRELRQGLVTKLVLSLLGVLAAAYLLTCLYKVVAGGLRVLGTHLERMAKGDFGMQPRALGRDEVGRALAALATSSNHMSHLLEAVTQGVSAVSHASREVAIGNAGLSGRTREMHQSIGDVARRTQSFATAMDTCAQEITTAAEHIRSMRANAQRSRDAVGGLRTRMRSLQGKSREITQVVGLVEAVAHQTKLLSLNASVEAARAGTAGKGFAVVAQEVRALAQRSEDAAQRIHAIVSASVEEIEDGNLLADRASDAVHSTDEKINAVNNLVTDVVQLTQGGMADSLEVLSIARNLESSANGNAQVVDQLSDASAALRTQGDTLKRSVQHFVFA